MSRKLEKEDALPDREAFTVEDGVLRANTDLYWEYLEEFDAACRRVLDFRGGRIEIDLTAVNFISSSFLGCLGNTVLGASRQKKRIRLKVTLDVSWLFEIMGAEKNVDIEVV